MPLKQTKKSTDYVVYPSEEWKLFLGIQMSSVDNFMTSAVVETKPNQL